MIFQKIVGNSDYEYKITAGERPVLVIIDLNLGGATVTNNAADILRRIEADGVDVDNVPIIYRDTDGNYDGIKRIGGTVNFFPLITGRRVTDEAEAIAAASAPVISPLDKALAKLRAAILTLPEKKQNNVIKWLSKWGSFLLNEKYFKPEKIPKYYRGDIVYVDFGWNIGNEYGGIHYAVIIENNSPKASGTILVVPLTSLEAGKNPSDIAWHSLYLGKDIIPWTNLDSVALPSHARAISKMRIVKPLSNKDKKARLTDAQMDALDDKIKQIALKPLPNKTLDT